MVTLVTLVSTFFLDMLAKVQGWNKISQGIWNWLQYSWFLLSFIRAISNLAKWFRIFQNWQWKQTLNEKRNTNSNLKFFFRFRHNFNSDERVEHRPDQQSGRSQDLWLVRRRKRMGEQSGKRKETQREIEEGDVVRTLVIKYLLVLK